MSKEALKQALEASKDLCTEFALAKVREILEEALTKQEQGEPVAKLKTSDVLLRCHRCGCSENLTMQIEYTTPQQRKPLTDEQFVEGAKAVDEIMEQAQVFASAWSLVGGRFDGGNAMDDAEAAKSELRVMVASLANAAAHGIKGQQ